jgi:hypothetical protein
VDRVVEPPVVTSRAGRHVDRHDSHVDRCIDRIERGISAGVTMDEATTAQRDHDQAAHPTRILLFVWIWLAEQATEWIATAGRKLPQAREVMEEK